MKACICPDVDVPLSGIPADPLACGCCGQPLELTCAGKCGEEHVRAAFATVTKVDWSCRRCSQPIARKPGRPPLYCEACLTPAERIKRDQQRAANDAVRARRLGAVAA